jgi:hypothetical protein
VNEKKQNILSVASFLRNVSNVISKSDNRDLEDEYFNQFCTFIHPDSQQIVNDDTICPIFIIVVGLWSSYYKKERHYSKPTKVIRNYKFPRLFLQRCLSYLLTNKVDPNIKQRHIHGSTAMHWLIAWDRSYSGVELIKLITKIQGAWDPNVVDASNRTAIALLVARKYFGRSEKAELEDNLLLNELIAYLADLTIKDNLGNTALHYAFIKKDKYFVDKIKQKYDLSKLLSIKNNLGQTPYDILDIKYEDSASLVRKVYEAATSEHIFHKKRWEESKSDFLLYVDSII